MGFAAAPSLSVVMPVYNEGASITAVAEEWLGELDALNTSYEFLLFDDGSRDETAARLRELAAKAPAVRVVSQDNIGHGPTILRGYRQTRGEWVFQTDSDGEIGADGLRDLWRRRDEYDFLLGRRANREAGLTRRVITRVSRVSVGLLFGTGIQDVNTPYRLMRGGWLRETISQLPDDLFAPNVILSGLAVRQGLRVFEMPVAHNNRRHGRSSLGSITALRPAATSLLQTLRVARRSRR